MSPIAVFGMTTDVFTDKVIALRKEIRAKGWDSESDQLYTVPHLTLAINKNFNLEKVDEIKNKLLPFLNKQKFMLKIKEFVVMDNNIAAMFDNDYSKKLAERVSKELDGLGFEIVVTDHMRLIRSEVKPEYIESVRDMVDKELNREIEIVGLAIAGKLLRKEDVLWSADFSNS